MIVTFLPAKRVEGSARIYDASRLGQFRNYEFHLPSHPGNPDWWRDFIREWWEE